MIKNTLFRIFIRKPFVKRFIVNYCLVADDFLETILVEKINKLNSNSFLTLCIFLAFIFINPCQAGTEGD